MTVQRLETMDLDGLGIQLEALLLVGQEFLHILALVALELDHLAHLRVVDDGAIASELLLDNLEDLFLVELLWQALHRGQGLTTIAFFEVCQQKTREEEDDGEDLRWIRMWM